MVEDITLAFGIIFMLVYFVLFVYAILSYVLESLSLYTLARRRGIANPWLAWIPYGKFWNLGAIVRDYDRQNGIKRRWDKVLLTLSIIMSACVFITYISIFAYIMSLAFQLGDAEMSEEMALQFVGMLFVGCLPLGLISSALSTLTLICCYKIFESTVSEKALKYFLIYLLVPFAAPFCLFSCRNKGYEHPDPLAYIYNPVDKDYSYYRSDAVIQKIEPIANENTDIQNELQNSEV